MASYDINFDNVEAPAPVVAMPRGKYPVEVGDVTMRQSDGGEFPYLNWQLSVTEDGGDNQGHPLYLMTSLSPKALWRLAAVFQALGVYQPQFHLEVDEDTGVIIDPPLAGLLGLADVIVERYQGELRNKVQTILPLPGMETAAPATPQAVAALATAPTSPVSQPQRPPVQRPAVAKGAGLK